MNVKKILRSIFGLFCTVVVMINLFSIPIYAQENNAVTLVPDYENATQTVYEDGSVEGTIPLIIESDDPSTRNITMPDGSQYRYSYMAGSHCWWYEFYIVEGFKSYSGSVVLTKLNTTNPQTKSVYCSGQSDTVELPLDTKRCGYSLSQTGIVHGMRGTKYIIPALNIAV